MSLSDRKRRELVFVFCWLFGVVVFVWLHGGLIFSVFDFFVYMLFVLVLLLSPFFIIWFGIDF